MQYGRKVFHTLMLGVLHHPPKEECIMESVECMLQLKYNLGMLDKEVTMDDKNLDLVGTNEALVLDMVCQSIILAKNNGDHPLQAV